MLLQVLLLLLLMLLQILLLLLLIREDLVCTSPSYSTGGPQWVLLELQVLKTSGVFSSLSHIERLSNFAVMTFAGIGLQLTFSFLASWSSIVSRPVKAWTFGSRPRN